MHVCCLLCAVCVLFCVYNVLCVLCCLPKCFPNMSLYNKLPILSNLHLTSAAFPDSPMVLNHVHNVSRSALMWSILHAQLVTVQMKGTQVRSCLGLPPSALVVMSSLADAVRVQGNSPLSQVPSDLIRKVPGGIIADSWADWWHGSTLDEPVSCVSPSS